MEYVTDLELVVSEDFIIGVDVEIDYTIENQSIGWYEYGGAKYYDTGDYEVIIDDYTVIHSEEYPYSVEELHFMDNFNLIEWLEKNDPEQYNWILNNIYEYDKDPKNHY